MKLQKAEISSLHTVDVFFDNPIPFVGVNIPGYTIIKVHNIDEEYRIHRLEIHEELQINQPLNINWNGQDYPVKLGEITKTDEFEQKYRYDGPLGVEINDDLTTFRLWSPVAYQVKLNLYADENPDTPIAQSYEMSRSPEGVWALSLQGDTEGLVYDFNIAFPDGITETIYDPYATACIVNGRRSVVLSYQTRNPKFVNNQRIDSGLSHDSEVLMMHCHIKTLTDHPSSGLHERLRGHYLGVIEPGTSTKDGLKTGFDYINQYKPSHFRLMPIADFGSVNEMKQDHYSVGDDLVNVNIPEGSYSSNPNDPIIRIIEVKKMIDGLHHKNIKVILDMMYSRFYNFAQHALEKTVPGYYFRINNNGKLINEIDSEKYMARRYILDSIKYWFQEYHIDGICLKDINCLDVQTVRQIREIADEIDPNIIIMGEHSEMGVHLDKDKQASLNNANQLFGVNFINSNIQKWLENYPNNDEKYLEALQSNMLGEFYDHDNINMLSPDQIVQTLKFIKKPDGVTDTVTWYIFILNLYFLSQGAISIDVITTMMKQNVDELEAIDWNKANQYQEIKDYLLKLIKFRSNNSIFTMAHYADINQKQHKIQLDNGVIAYSLHENQKTYTVVINCNINKQTVSLPTGKYTVLMNNNKIYDYPSTIEIFDELEVSGTTVMLLARK